MIRFFLTSLIILKLLSSERHLEGSGIAVVLLPARFKAPRVTDEQNAQLFNASLQTVELGNQSIQDQANAFTAKMESDRLLAEEEAKLKRDLLREESQARLKAMDTTLAQYRHLANFLRSICNQPRLLYFGIALSFLGQR